MTTNAQSLATAPDLEALLAPVAEQQEAGSDLDGTLELSALEMAVREPEQAPIEGIESEDERDWRAIHQQAHALLMKSKDLRVAVQLARARLQTQGLYEFCAALSFVSELAQRYWPSAYPALEPDSGDSTARINALQELASAPVLAQLRGATLGAAPGLGPVSVKDAIGAASAPAASAPQTVSVHVMAALDAFGPAGLRERLELVQSARRSLAQLVAFVSQETGHALRFAALTASKGERPGVLDALEQLLTLSRERPASTGGQLNGSALERDAAQTTVAGLRVGANAIACRADVVATLDVLCAYYDQAEPSSPVPLLLRRAQRLVPLDFFAIMRDLARQGLPEVALVAGIQTDHEDSLESDE